MKSKEEIFRKHTYYKTKSLFHGGCMAAMDGYAKEVAIAFAEWLGNNYMHMSFNNLWYPTKGTGEILASPAELFNKFLTEHKI